MTEHESSINHQPELSEEQLNSVAGGSTSIKNMINREGLIRYKYSCLSCGAARPSGRIQFAHSIDGHIVYGVTFTCCNYLCGCTEENLESC